MLVRAYRRRRHAMLFRFVIADHRWPRGVRMLGTSERQRVGRPCYRVVIRERCAASMPAYANATRRAALPSTRRLEAGCVLHCGDTVMCGQNAVNARAETPPADA